MTAYERTVLGALVIVSVILSVYLIYQNHHNRVSLSVTPAFLGSKSR